MTPLKPLVPDVMSTTVVIPKQVQEDISRWAEKAYPHEGCGVLVGNMKSSTKEVVRFSPLQNKLLDKAFENVTTLPAERLNRPEVGFAMDPAEFSKAVLTAEKDNLDVVGIIHTHPDHPPRPSKIDESQPFLAQWSNVIVAVHQGKMAEMKSWFRETDGQPFIEEKIQIQ